MESTTIMRMADNATGGKGQTTRTSNKSSCLTAQGDNDGSNDSGVCVWSLVKGGGVVKHAIPITKSSPP